MIDDSLGTQYIILCISYLSGRVSKSHGMCVGVVSAF